MDTPEPVTATCSEGHQWKAQQTLVTDWIGGIYRTRRVVTPERCPECGRRWAQAAQPFRSGRLS